MRLAMARLVHSRWNTVDAVIILLALLPVVGGGIAVLRVARLARMAHLTRHVTGLRLLGCSGPGGAGNRTRLKNLVDLRKQRNLRHETTPRDLRIRRRC
jgi:phosphate/sulfate permease